MLILYHKYYLQLHNNAFQLEHVTADDTILCEWISFIRRKQLSTGYFDFQIVISTSSSPNAQFMNTAAQFRQFVRSRQMISGSSISHDQLQTCLLFDFKSGLYARESLRHSVWTQLDNRLPMCGFKSDNTQMTANSRGARQLSAIDDHLKAMDKVCKLNYWVPHKLSDNSRQRLLDACTSSLSKERTTDWLNTIVTGDEK